MAWRKFYSWKAGRVIKLTDFIPALSVIVGSGFNFDDKINYNDQFFQIKDRYSQIKLMKIQEGLEIFITQLKAYPHLLESQLKIISKEDGWWSTTFFISSHSKT